MKIDREFPFSHVIVTAPSPPIAELYNIQLRQLQDSFAFLAKCCMICVSDPIEGRVGSGGGTWNAMAVAIQHIGLSACNETKVLVIHSGGESRRLPTHSLCGKAWLSMNHKLNDEVVCPLLLLIMESVELCQNLSPPYIVVGCGDVLLQLKTKGELKDLSDGVYIVSVLANESTAQNHGVVTINDELRTLPVGDKATQVLNAADYLQKPSPSDMEYHKAFVSTESVNSRLVLIDTGLVIFCGAPVMEMFNLAKHYSPSSVNPWSSIQIDMFLEVLFACQKEGCIETNAQYKSKLMRTSSSFTNDVYMDAIDTIYRTMNTIPLRTVICNFGQFYHLGTMNEILDVFLHEETSGGYTNGETSKSIQSIAHCGSSEIVKIGSYLHPSVVISSPFERGFVEYSHLSDCYIPSRCVISHIDASTASRVGRFLQDCVFQKAYMNCIEGDQSYVLLGLHINDNPKLLCTDPRSTILGVSWEIFFKVFHCCRSDVWDDNELECSLWTAKLFPLYSEKPDGSIFGWDVDGKAIVLKFDSIYWMGDLLNSRSTKATNMWKGLKRKSLSDMLLEGSAAKMLSWRTWMKSVWLSRHNGYHWSWKVSDSLHQRWLGLTSAFTRIDVAAFVAILFSSGIIVDCTILCSKIIDLVAPLIQVRADHIREELEQKQPALVNFIDQAGDNCLSLLVPYWVSYLGKSVSLAIAHTAMSADALLGIPSKSLPRLLLWASVILENCGYLMHNHVQEEIEFRNWQGIISEKLSVEAQLQRYGEKAVECSSSLLSSSAARSGSYGAERLQLFAQMLILSFIEVSNKFAVDSVLQGFRFSRFRGANGRYSLALAPARIDMAGGWSDTPPICFDIGGAVLNVAVMIDGKKPIRCMVRCIEGDAAIRLISYGRVSNGDISSLATEECCSYLDFMDLSHSSSPFALVRACIVALGVVDPSGTSGSFLDYMINEVGFGLEISICSLLPAGSGMGGSSILAAAVLQALSSALSSQLSLEALVYLVNQVEQLLHTGGGWQDQVGGCFGGFKIARSFDQLPLQVKVENIDCSAEFVSLFNRRTHLVYTGQQRLARNTLINALKMYAVGGRKSKTVKDLIQNAERCVDSLRSTCFSEDERYSQLAEGLTEYWKLKQQMAHGSNPPWTQQILECASSFCVGSALCGAGAGGYAVIMSRGDYIDALADCVRSMNLQTSSSEHQLSIHSVTVDLDGLVCDVGLDTTIVPNMLLIN